MKLGKLPYQPDVLNRDLKMVSYIEPKLLPKPPRKFGSEDLVKEWGVLGNDFAGDCVWAGGGHEHMLWSAMSECPVQFSTDSIIKAYSDVTGYKKGDDSTDQGTLVRDALIYRRDTGLVDTQGNVHKLGAFVALEPGNTEHLYQAMYLFGAVGIGIEFPGSAMGQFNKGKPWVPVKGSMIEGGHYIPLVARRSMLCCVTWGKLQAISTAFYKKYCDEAWAFVSIDMLKVGKSFLGFDMPALLDDLKQVGVI